MSDNIEDIVGNKIVFHLDPSQINLMHNQAISEWEDSGRDKKAIQGESQYRPIYKANVTDGLPAVRFDPINSYEGQHLIMHNPGITSNVSLIMSLYAEESNYYNILGEWDEGFYLRKHWHRTQSKFGDNVVRGKELPTGRWITVAIFSYTDYYTVFIDNIPYHTTSTVSDLDITRFGIGRALGSVHNFSGYFGDMLALEGISETEMRDAVWFLGEKWSGNSTEETTNLVASMRLERSLKFGWGHPSSLFGGEYDVKLLEETPIPGNELMYKNEASGSTTSREYIFPASLSTQIYLEWEPLSENTIFRAQLSTNPYFSSILDYGYTSDPEFTFDNLDSQQVYYIRVQRAQYLGGVIEEWENHYFHPPTTPAESALGYLKPSTNYYFNVRARNIWDTPSNWNRLYTRTLLSPTEDLRSLQVFPHSFEAHWEDIPGADWYEIQIRIEPFEEGGGTQSFEYEDTEVEESQYLFDFSSPGTMFTTLMMNTGSFAWRVRGVEEIEEDEYNYSAWKNAVGLMAARLVIRLDSRQVDIELDYGELVERWTNYSMLSQPVYFLQEDHKYKPTLEYDDSIDAQVLGFRGKNILESNWLPTSEAEEIEGEELEDLAESGMTIMLAVRPDRSANQTFLNSQGSIYVGTNNEGNLITTFGVGSQEGGHLSPHQWHIIVLRFDTTSDSSLGDMSVFVDGHRVQEYAAHEIGGSDGLKVGSLEEDQDFAISEVLIFQRALSDIEYRAVESSLQEKWMNLTYLSQPRNLHLTNFDSESFKIEWSPVEGSTHYEIIFAERVTIEELEIGEEGLEDYEFEFFETLDSFKSLYSEVEYSSSIASSEVYCLVRAVGDNSVSPWSSYNFIPAIEPPESLWNSSIDFHEFTVAWSPVEGASRYLLQLSDDRNFDNIIEESDIDPEQKDDILPDDLPTSQEFSGYEQNTTYYWRVKAFIEQGDSLYHLSYTTIRGKGSTQESEWTEWEVKTLQIPHIFLHLDANDMGQEYSEDQKVARWLDLSGNDNNSFQNVDDRRPIFVTDDRLGNSCVQFSDGQHLINTWNPASKDMIVDHSGEEVSVGASVGFSLFTAVKLNSRRDQSLFGVWGDGDSRFYLRSTTKGYLQAGFGHSLGWGRELERQVPWLLRLYEDPLETQGGVILEDYRREWFIFKFDFQGSRTDDGVSGTLESSIHVPPNLSTPHAQLSFSGQFGDASGSLIIGGIEKYMKSLDAEIGEIKAYNFDLSGVPGEEFNQANIISGMSDKWFGLKEDLTGVHTSDITSESFTLNWNEPLRAQMVNIELHEDGVDEVLESASLNIYKEQSEEEYTTSDGPTTSYVIEGLEGSKEYRFRINSEARRAEETVYYTPSRWIEGVVKTKLHSPQNLEIDDITERSFTLGWDAVENAQTYEIELHGPPSTTTTNSASSFDLLATEITDQLFYHFDDLYPDSEYYLRVRALGEGFPSSDFTTSDIATTYKLPQLETPDEFYSGDETLTSFDIGWSEVEDAEDYHIDISTDNSFNNIIQSVDLSSLIYTVDGLDISTVYYWRIRASAEDFRDSEYVSGTSQTISGIPQNLSNSDITCLGFKANWDHVNGHDNYVLELSDDPDFDNILSAVTTTDNYSEFSDLDFITTYYWRVKATFPNTGDSSYNSLLVVTNQQPRPSDLMNQDITFESFKATWSDMEQVDSYNIELSDDQYFNNVITDLTVFNNYYEFSGLDPDTRYYWRVVGSHNICGDTQVSYFTIKLPSIVPSGLRNSNIGPNRFTASWVGVPGASEYELEVAEDINFEQIISSSVISDTYSSIMGLDNTTVYYWRVRSLFDTRDPSIWVKNEMETLSEWLRKYPNDIHVRLGDMWVGKNDLLGEDNIIISRIPETSIWTENGASGADDAENRIKFDVTYVHGDYVEEKIYVADQGVWIEGGNIVDSINDYYSDGLFFRQLWNGNDVDDPTENWSGLYDNGFIDQSDADYRGLFPEMGVTGWELLTEVNDVEYIDGPLEEGSYHYRIKAVNSLGRESLPSNEESFEIKTAPLPPTRLNYESIDNYSKIVLSWVGSESVDVNYYNIYCSSGSRRINLNSDTSIIATVDHKGNVVHNYTFNDFSEDGTYLFLVRAVDFHGHEEANVGQSFVARYFEDQEKQGRKPAEFYSVQAEATEGGIVRVSWVYDPIQEDGTYPGAAYGAKIYYRSDEQTTTEGEGYPWWQELMRRPTMESEYTSEYQVIDLTEVEDGIYKFEVKLVIYSEEDGGLYYTDDVWREVEFHVDTPGSPELSGKIK